MFLPCSHGFDKTAILMHIKRVSAECPVCRTSIHISTTELGLTAESPDSEKIGKCIAGGENSDSEIDNGSEDDDDSATLDSEEPRSEETGSMGSLRDFIEDDDEEADSVDDEEVDYVPTEEEDDTISSESEDEEFEVESEDSEASEEKDDDSDSQ